MNSSTASVKPEDRYRSSCGMVYGYSLGGMIVLAAAGLFLTVGFITQLVTGADALALMKTLFLIYITVIMCLISDRVRRIFGELRKAETPFIDGISVKMRRLAGLFALGGAAADLFPLSGLILNIPGSSVFAAAYILSAFMIASGYIFNAFVFVFERGCILQQESDETL